MEGESFVETRGKKKKRLDCLRIWFVLVRFDSSSPPPLSSSPEKKVFFFFIFFFDLETVFYLIFFYFGLGRVKENVEKSA